MTLLPLAFCGIIFTFDDGPWQGTNQVLDILAQNKIHAVFCIPAVRLLNKKNVLIAKRILREGHIICNHSYTHPNFAKISAKRQRFEIAYSQYIFKKKLGYVPKYFRPPSGVITPTQRKYVAMYGMRYLMWHIYVYDWKRWISTKSIIKYFTDAFFRRRKNPTIILLHDINPRSIKALPKVIEIVSNKCGSKMTRK